ncbi:MAG: hypothetical protein K2P92_09120, partial [Bdellovibrionaceae bacterium]|nr:hypothetical protein [Pseudobdellovibrionaceae bacterium]
MKALKLFLIVGSLLAVEAASANCRDVPAGADGQRSQRVRDFLPRYPGFTGAGGDGEDVIYEGGSCPANSICLETIFRTNRTQSGAVIVIDKATGRARYNPIRLPGARTTLGIPARNPQRLTAACGDCGVAGDSNPYNPVRPNVILGAGDLASELGEGYGFSTIPTDRRGRIRADAGYLLSLGETLNQAFNDAGLTKPGNASQAPSLIGESAVTTGNLMAIVGSVRASLGCEPENTAPNAALHAALLNTQFPANCNMSYTLRNRNYQFSTYPTDGRGQPREAYCNEQQTCEHHVFPIGLSRVSTRCTSQARDIGVEVYTCPNPGAGVTEFWVQDNQVRRVVSTSTIYEDYNA